MRGRLGIDHLLDLELLAFALASMGAKWPAMVLLDMQAAFPRLSHRYLHRVVRKLAGAHPNADMVEDMYIGASTQLLVNGEVSEGFPTSTWGRQGCPASGASCAFPFHDIFRAGPRRLLVPREGRLPLRRLRLRGRRGERGRGFLGLDPSPGRFSMPLPRRKRCE